MAKKGSASWIIPVAALALPGLIFYFWWAKLGGAHKTPVLNPSRKTPAQGVFSAAPPGSKLSNPQRDRRTAPRFLPVAVSSRTTQIHSAAPFQAPRSSSAVLAGRALKTPSSAAPAKFVKPAPLSRSGAAGGNAMASSPVAPPPELKRDPTLSPEDRQEIYDRLHPKPKPKIVYHRPRKKKGPPIETLIDLEGIIFVSPTNVKAIVNGNIVRSGELVKGARIVSIGRGKVVFSYRGRRFVKVMKGNQ